MLSRLDPLIVPVIRKAEGADAKLAIRRDESKNQGKSKNGQGCDEYSPVSWEDSAIVSTASLRAFLQNLLGAPVTAPVISDEADRHAPTSLGARAAGAYQSVGRAVHDRNVEPEAKPVPVPSSEDTQLKTDFGDADLVRIQGYVAALSDLESKGIHDISIQKSLTFLDSIAQGIAAAGAMPV